MGYIYTINNIESVEKYVLNILECNQVEYFVSLVVFQIYLSRQKMDIPGVLKFAKSIDEEKDDFNHRKKIRCFFSSSFVCYRNWCSVYTRQIIFIRKSSKLFLHQKRSDKKSDNWWQPKCRYLWLVRMCCMHKSFCCRIKVQWSKFRWRNIHMHIPIGDDDWWRWWFEEICMEKKLKIVIEQRFTLFSPVYAVNI